MFLAAVEANLEILQENNVRGRVQRCTDISLVYNGGIVLKGASIDVSQ